MSDYDFLLNNLQNSPCIIPSRPTETICSPVGQLFTIDNFITNVYNKSLEKNKSMMEESKHINAYDIAKNCIREIVYRLQKHPVEVSADNWLPLKFRAMIGSAIHDFIQTNYPFTENEISLRVPSLKTSVRIDSLINNDILVEIKGLPFKDYDQVLRKNQPRSDDFLQAVLYKYLIENHLSEIKSVDPSLLRSQLPQLNKYKIDTIQFIYVAHDLISSDISSIKQAFEIVDNLKKILNSKKNQFYFISVLNINVKDLDLVPYYDYITKKIKKINDHIDSNTIPDNNDEFLDGNCYFCQYRRVCSK